MRQQRALLIGVKPLPASIAIALSSIAAIHAAHAQEAGATTPGVLPTVTVTAERRAENVKDVPSSVYTLSGEKLDVLNSSGEDIRALSGRVPSLNIESSFGRAFPRFYIRGYGNTDFRLNASQPVSLIYDDVVQENPILKGFPVFDVDKVEVLAGPQGTLFGRNTPGGVVKFDSVKPGRKAEGYFNGTIGRFGTVNLEGAYTMPLNDEWSSRISIQSQHRDDWVHNQNPAGPTQGLEGYDDQAIRAQLAYDPRGGPFSALLNLHGRDLKGSARLFRANIIEPKTNNLAPGFDPYKVSYDGANEQTLNSSGGSLRLKWALPGVNLYSITGFESVRSYSRGDVDGGVGPYVFFGPDVVFTPGKDSRVPSETADQIHGHAQWTQEFRAESTSPGPLKWQGGVYFFHEKYGVNSFDYNSLAGNVQDALIQTSQKNNAWAVFGSVGYEVTTALNLRGGLRYTHDKKELVTEPGIYLNPDLRSKTANDSKVSWDVSSTYKVTPDMSAYARVATGFRGSSIQQPSLFSGLTFAAPETTTSYEVGLKGDLFDKRARFSVSAYHYDVRDQQLTIVGGGGNGNILFNAKKVVGNGLEGTLDAFVTDNLLLSLNGSYNKTRIKDPALTVGVCAACTVTSPRDASGNAYIDGNPLPMAPKVIANISARYSIPAANGAEWYVYTDWTYRSKVNFFLYESVEFTGKSLTQGGLRVGYIWSNGKYEAAAFVRNITDQVRVTGGIDFTNLTGFINDPRTYGVQFKALF